MRASAKKRNLLPLAVGIALVLLVAKFTLPAVWFGLPIGYDAGMYRYLFLSYGKVLPPLVWPVLPAWAMEHPVGLFLFTTPLIKLGLPVDWLIGWIWNVFPVLLGGVLAWIIHKKHGRLAGFFTLVAVLLSVSFYDGYAAMYWKTYAALLWMVLAFVAIERKSLWALPCILFTLVTHHQTGLLFGLAVGSYWLWHLPTHWRDPRWRWGTVALGGIVVLSVLFYLPLWQRAIEGPLQALFLLRGDAAPGGSFPPLSFYLGTEGILLLLGAYGFALNLRKERGTLWQFAVLWAAVFVLFRLVFYRRFVLQLDFFLLPFAGIALAYLWQSLKLWTAKGFLVAALIVQAGFSIWVVTQRRPSVDLQTLAVVQSLPGRVPAGAAVLNLENLSSWFVQGYLPETTVGGPGLLDWPGWDMATWEQFLLTGRHDQRVPLFWLLPNPTVVFVSPLFRAHYGEAAQAFLRDPCLQPIDEVLYRNICLAPTR